MRFEILGPLRVLRDGVPVKVGGPREQKVLVTLLLEAGRPLSRTRLAASAWGDAPPATARAQIHNSVAAIRRSLGPQPAIMRAGGGFLLDLAGHELDLTEFTALAAERDGGADPAAAARRLRAALALWRGAALEGLTDGALAADAQRLEERRLDCLEQRVDLDLRLGRCADLPAELGALIGAHPLRETLVERYMWALCRAGRRPEALAAYAALRRRLADELGVDPSPSLRQLHTCILRDQVPAPDRPHPERPDPPGPAAADPAGGEPVAATSPAPARPAPVGPAPAPGGARACEVPRQLPAGTRHFVGRAEELRVLDKLAAPDATAVVISAIAGTAGIGKTALALHWAHRVADRFPDGQLYLNLGGFDPAGSPLDPAEALRGFLDALGVPAGRIPGDLAGRAARYRSLLAGRRVLVVLDNARDADQVRALLPGDPACLAVVTSRSRLTDLVAVEGAQPLTLDLLSAGEAEELIRRHVGDGRVAAEPEAAAALGRYCARLPLAVAVAAARAAVSPELPLAALTAELAEVPARLSALETGHPARSPRAVFSWSYRALPPAAQRLFRLLGLHPGPDLAAPAAASLAGLPVREVRPLLAELARAHLVTEPAPGRYGCHDLLRAYAAELASTEDSEPDRQEAVRRLLDHYLHTADAADQWFGSHRRSGPLPEPQPGAVREPIEDYPSALRWFTAEYRALLAVVRLAASAGLDAQLARLAATLTVFLDRRGHWHDLAAVQEAALAAARRSGQARELARASSGCALAYANLGRYDDAVAHLEEALRRTREVGEPVAVACTHNNLAWALERQGRYRRALRHVYRASRLFAEASNHPGHGNSLNMIGWYHAQLGELRQALHYCRQAVDLQREHGDRRGEAYSLDSLGHVYHRLGDHRAAVGCYRRALGLSREIGERRQEADLLTHLGDAQHAAGETGTAAESWRQALTILEQLQHPDADGLRDRLSRDGQA